MSSPSFGDEAMRQTFDPFEKCRGAPSRAAEPLWLNAAVAMIVQLAYVYDTLSKGHTVDNLLEELTKKLDEIRVQLEEANRRLDEIIFLLERMPALVRGQVDDAFLSALLGQADGIVGNIQAASLDVTTIVQDPQSLRRSLQDLWTTIGGIKGVGSAKGLFLAAPFIGTWLAGACAHERAMVASDPTWQVQSPWDNPNWKKTEVAVRAVLDKMDQQDVAFETSIIPGLPPFGASLEVVNKTLIPQRPQLPFPVSGDYRLVCPTGRFAERLQYYVGERPGTSRPYGWKDVLEHDSYHQPALDAWASLKANRHEISAFYEMAPELVGFKAKILAIFAEPADFWERR
jgi:hypothetical protein